MTRYSEDSAELKARFERDTANHRMTVLLDDGLHRHLRFSRKGDSAYHFNITTWPGYLSISGDMGGYVFSRVPDMFAFFRADSGRINPYYWGQKLTAKENPPTEFDDDVFEQVLREYIDNHFSLPELLEEVEGEWPEDAEEPEPSTWFWKPQPEEKPLHRSFYGSITSYSASDADEDRHGPFATEEEALNDLKEEVWQHISDEILGQDTENDKIGAALNYKCEISGGDFEDIWEYDFKSYTFHYLWCLHAIVYGIQEYDRYKRALAPRYCVSQAA